MGAVGILFLSLLICDSLRQSGLNEGGESECGSCEREKESQIMRLRRKLQRARGVCTRYWEIERL